MAAQPDPRSRPPSSPEIEPPPGSPPKRFPSNPEPLTGEETPKPGAEMSEAASPSEDPETPATRLGSGEDPNVESGVDKDDPERPASGDDDV